MARKKKKTRSKRTVFQKEELAVALLMLVFTGIAFVLIVLAEMSQDSALANIGLASGFIVLFLGFLNWMLKQSQKKK